MEEGAKSHRLPTPVVDGKVLQVFINQNIIHIKQSVLDKKFWDHILY